MNVGSVLTTLDTHAIVSVADRHGDILAVNENFCRISGYTREELIGQSHRSINSGHHPREFWVGMWKTIATGQSWRADVCNRAKDGSLYWADSIIAPFVDGEGKIEKYVSIRHDLTARKQAERQLIETSKLLQGVLDAATETSIIAVDAAPEKEMTFSAERRVQLVKSSLSDLDAKRCSCRSGIWC